MSRIELLKQFQKIQNEYIDLNCTINALHLAIHTFSLSQ